MAGSWDIIWWFVALDYRGEWSVQFITDAELDFDGYKLGRKGAIEYANDNLRSWNGPYKTEQEARTAMNMLKRKNPSGSDLGHDYADKKISELQGRFDETYSQAAREMNQKLDRYLAQYEAENTRWKKMVRDGSATAEQYDGWLKGQSVRRDYLVDMCDTLARDATRVNQLAFEMINDEVPSVYAENANYAAYDIERRFLANTHAFDLVDESTVRHMMGLDGEDQVIKEVVLLPEEVKQPLRTLRKVGIDEAKDVRWNRQKFNAAITQSILQGESIPNTAKRLTAVLNMDKGMAVRAARTAVTSAENAGRVSSYVRAQGMGIKLEMQWVATFDERTRYSHRELHGQHVPIGDKFVVPSNGHKLSHPADPTADPSEVWNCRCTLEAWSPELEAESTAEWVDMQDGTTYEEWKAGLRHGETLGISRWAYVNPSSPVWSMLGGNVDASEVAAKVNEMLSGAHGDAAALWRKFESGLIMYDPDYTDGAFFDPAEGIINGKERHRGVQMNVRRSLDNVSKRGTLSTWFHEFGHHIDNLASGRQYGWGSHDDGFGDVLKNEVDGIIKARQKKANAELKALRKSRDLRGMLDKGIVGRWNRRTVDDYYDVLDHIDDDDWLKANHYYFIRTLDGTEARRDKAWEVFAKWADVPQRNIPIKDIRERYGWEITDSGKTTQLALGDIFEGATRGQCKDTYGHGTSYWDTQNKGLALEAFAEFYSAECCYSENPEVLDKMIETLPKSYEAYRKIVKGML